MMRRYIALIVAVALCLCVTACADTTPSEPTAGSTTGKSTTTTTTTATTTTTTKPTENATQNGTTTKPTEGTADTDKPDTNGDIKENGVGTAYPDEKLGFQLEKPEVGEQIVILHTNKGSISIRLFPEAAPKAVENFVTHVKNGYYNGLTFHRVVKDFMIQGGDPKGDGTGGESIWGEDFDDEFDQKLINITGAVAMANGGLDDDGNGTNGSQFFINQCSPESFGKQEEYSPEYREKVAQDIYKKMVESYGQEVVDQYYPGGWKDIITDQYVYDWIPDEAWALYKKYGGNLHLDGAYRREGGHTVFGQVFEGMDVVETIANVVVNDTTSKPVISIVIESAEVTTYQGK